MNSLTFLHIVDSAKGTSLLIFFIEIRDNRCFLNFRQWQSTVDFKRIIRMNASDAEDEFRGGKGMLSSREDKMKEVVFSNTRPS